MASLSDSKTQLTQAQDVVIHLGAPKLTSSEACGSYLWEIENEEKISSFLQAENGTRFKSAPFSIGKLQWLLEAFPNGDRQDNIGSFMVYLTLVGLPNTWLRVTFLLRLFSAETASSFTGIASYTKTSNSGGWSDGTMLLKDLKLSIKKAKTNQISLGCKINVLQLIGTENNEKLYEHPLKAEYISIMKSSNPIFDVKWVINKSLLQKFRLSNIGKKFESDIFYDIWSLRCAPNGKRENDKGNVKLYLLLCALPPDIVHCKVKYILSCDEAHVQWTNTRDFSYKYPNVGWPNGTMLTNELKTKYKHLKQLTFRAKIHILKVYDHEVSSSDDDDDSSSSSSSYDSSEAENDDDDDDDDSEDNEHNENDDLGDIKTDIMHSKFDRAQRRRSLAKKSAVKRRQSQEIVLPPIPLIPNVDTKQAHLRQETDINTNVGGMQLQKFVIHSPNTPGLQMQSEANHAFDIAVNHAFGNGANVVIDEMNDEQFENNKDDDDTINNNVSIVNEENESNDEDKRPRASTVVEHIEATVEHKEVHSNRARNDSHIKPYIKRRAEIEESVPLEYQQRLLSLENNFKTMSCKLNDITLKLTRLSLKGSNDSDLYKILNNMRIDIGLIKHKLMDEAQSEEINAPIKEWLTVKVALPEYFDIFMENGLDDLEIIKDLTEDELISIGIIKLGHRKKIMKCIHVL